MEKVKEIKGNKLEDIRKMLEAKQKKANDKKIVKKWATKEPPALSK